MKRLLIAVLSLSVLTADAGQRLKDLVKIQGVRSNPILGYGLVVGLTGTGDNSALTDQTYRNLARELGITLAANARPGTDNVAVVTVHADLPPFAKPGQNLDVTVSSMGNAASLRGGTLLMTPLKGADGNIYAVAQGNMIVGGFGASGEDGSSIQVNIPSVGRIPNGAIIERAVPNGFSQGDEIIMNLHEADFTTAQRVANAINDLLGGGVAAPMDAISIRVTAPRDPSQRVEFLSLLENVEVEPDAFRSRVVVNSRTGTIVIGENVRLRPTAITHGSMVVTVTEDPAVSQPGAFADGGTTEVVPQSTVDIEQTGGRMFLFGPAVTLRDLVAAVNKVGATPSDLMGILEALKQAGALEAELVVL
ncbi:flagellar basal body P-ring protein FlgI [Litorivicinus lipolyticus]|uniref:Flagellar P-ring protein n=1 Tax=Litorivicinus lipolyticus TaxID=418701 RepID=A0A5Q2QDW4_9GAMM|nr:flagellar basal body P-ring protein FlgI [Litorivicinus lipolyticus]QGG80216.1 flagellar basal body P-ring protein FlgI [Litorivicinus lipolyticus]